MLFFGTNPATQEHTEETLQLALLKIERARATNEQQAESGIQRESKNGRHQHSEIFRVREWPEKFAFLSFQHKNGEEGDRNHQQREEGRAGDFLYRFQNDFVVAERLAGTLIDLELLVSLLDDDNGRIHQLPAPYGQSRRHPA